MRVAVEGESAGIRGVRTKINSRVIGCVGSGKTTVMAILQERMPDWVFLPEPLHRFEEAPLQGGGPPVNYLKEFYDRPGDPGAFRRLQVGVWRHGDSR
jgi:hypothetical protein